MGQAGEHGIWSHAAPSWESPFVSPGYLAIQRELISERAYRVEYGAEFLDASGRVFRSECLERCVVGRLPGGVSAPYYIGVDLARYGDFTAVCVLGGDRSGAQLLDSLRINSVSWTEQVERVATLIERYPNSRVLCDATGAGDPVIEMLQSRLRSARIEGIVFTNRVKATLIDGLAWLIERGNLLMEPNPELMKELQHFEATPIGQGVRLAARSGFHDDLVVALALAAHQMPRNRQGGVHEGERRRFGRAPRLSRQENIHAAKPIWAH